MPDPPRSPQPVGGHQQRYGTSIGKYRTQDCTRLVRALLETFRRLMLSQESFGDTVNRTGFAAFKDGILAHGIQGELVRPPRAAPAPAT